MRSSSTCVLLVAESAKHFARVPGPWPVASYNDHELLVEAARSRPSAVMPLAKRQTV
jgi:hypothetical protein